MTRLAAVLVLLAACAPPPAADPPEPAQKTTELPAPPTGGYLDRGQLEVVLREGPPWLLERVPIEEVMEGDKFVGWRVQDLPREWTVDLQPGDVILTVNAMPIETPNDFWTAWTSLSVASELKVAYLREGEPREMSIPIYGQPSPALAKDLQERGPDSGRPPESPVKANQDYAPPKQSKTITIKGDDKPLSDTNTDWSNEP
jgi:hypothetical protein